MKLLHETDSVISAHARKICSCVLGSNRCEGSDHVFWVTITIFIFSGFPLRVHDVEENLAEAAALKTILLPHKYQGGGAENLQAPLR